MVPMCSMSNSMEQPMVERSANSAEKSARSDEMSAIDMAKEGLIELCGTRGWHDTRDSWIARGARKVPMSPRRARAIIQKEQHTKVSGDELLAIQRARAALESLSAVAREAHRIAYPETQRQGDRAAGEDAPDKRLPHS
jgi:hypothetical protein